VLSFGWLNVAMRCQRVLRIVRRQYVLRKVSAGDPRAHLARDSVWPGRMPRTPPARAT
jgi:hypothetical protein